MKTFILFFAISLSCQAAPLLLSLEQPATSQDGLTSTNQIQVKKLIVKPIIQTAIAISTSEQTFIITNSADYSAVTNQAWPQLQPKEYANHRMMAFYDSP